MDRRAAIASLLLASSCAAVDEPGPRLLAVTPSQGENAQAIAVAISGANLKPRAVSDFTRAKNSAIENQFQAFLLPSDAGQAEIALTAVAWQSAQGLTAVVPAGVARGFYGVKVVDPFGRVAQLPEVYRAVRSASELASFHVSPLGTQRAGVPFWLEVTAVDAAGDVVDGFSGTVSLSNRSNTLTPTTLGPFAVGRGQALVAVDATATADAIAVSDGQGHTGQSNDFSVETGTAVAVAFTSAPQTLDAGACSAELELQLRDAQSLASVAAQDITVALAASPPIRAAFYSDAACTRSATWARFAAGQSRLAFYVRAQVAGALVIRAQPDALPSATQAETVRALAPSRLEFASPSQVLAAGACSKLIALQSVDALGNASAPASATIVSLAASPPESLSLFADEACAVPTAGGALGASGDLTFYVRGDGAGASAVTASAPAAALFPAQLVLTVTP